MKNFVLGLAVLALVVIAFQNTGTVETRLLLVTLMIPKVVIMLAMFVGGVVTGFLLFCQRGLPEESQPVHRVLDRSRSGDPEGPQRTRQS